MNAASAHMGGAITYLKNVLTWLPRVAPEDRFIVYVPAATKEKLSSTGDSDQVKLVAYPFSNTAGAIRLYFDQVFLPRLAAKMNADVLFSTTGFGTFYSPCSQVLLIRNLAYFDKAFQDRYKELGRSLRKNTIRRWHSVLSMRFADTILFPTQAMKEMVELYINLDRKHTAAIHYGFDHEAFSGNGSTTGHDIVNKAQSWKNEGYKLLLNVSTFAVQKNFETLIEALPHIIANGHKLKFLTTISREKTTDKSEYDAMMKRAKQLGVEDAIVEVGYVPYQQLHTLYEVADVYVFPSFTESFGHSMVEAMASGLPVVAADTPVNREVCSDAALYFETYDPKDATEKIINVLNDTTKKNALETASTNRARHYSWHRYAQSLKEIFDETT